MPDLLPEQDAWNGNEFAMVFDGETGNAVDWFPFTVEELESRLAMLRGDPIVTMEPTPWARLS